MCTWVTEQVEIAGHARGVPEWIRLSRVNVLYDHPVIAPYDHALIIDFVEPADGPGARVAVELSAASARALVRAIESALACPEAVRDLESQAAPA